MLFPQFTDMSIGNEKENMSTKSDEADEYFNMRMK